MNGTTLGLRISSRYLYIQIAIDKMQLCSLFVAYACPYYKPTATTGHSVHTTPYTWSVVVRWVGHAAEFSKMMVEKLTLNSLATALVEISAVSMQIAHTLNLRPLWHCCVTKRHILKLPFVGLSTRCTCVNSMVINQLLDMPHLSVGWIILAEEKCSLTGK
jgi:hypothetical protein